MKTQKDIKLKTGDIIPKGASVSFIKDYEYLCLVHCPSLRTEPFKVRTSSAFKAPSLKTLQKQSFNGYCKAISGLKTEPDGWCYKGTPSWMLALGLI